MIQGIGSGGGYSPMYAARAQPTRAQGGACGEEKSCGSSATASGARSVTGEPLTKEQEAYLEKLKARDAEVRQHEQAHVAAAGGHVSSGPHYQFTQGPDGKQYATGGHVNLDTSTPADPEEAARKAQALRRAAIAPAEPSGQDRSVAAQASQMEQSAREAIREQEELEREGETSDAGAPAISDLRQLPGRRPANGSAPDAADEENADRPLVNPPKSNISPITVSQGSEQDSGDASAIFGLIQGIIQPGLIFAATA